MGNVVGAHCGAHMNKTSPEVMVSGNKGCRLPDFSPLLELPLHTRCGKLPPTQENHILLTHKDICKKMLPTSLKLKYPTTLERKNYHAKHKFSNEKVQ